MRRLRAALIRLLAPLTRARREREFAEEIAGHIEMHTADNVRAGLTPAEARRQALVKFGGIEAAKEIYRDRAGLAILSHLAQDLRYATRWVRSVPVFSATVIATTTLAVGVNTAIFTILNAAVLRPLPTPNSRDLVSVALHLEGPGRRAVHGLPSLLSWPEFVAVRDQVREFSSATAFSPFNPVTLGGTEARQILVTVASCEYFETLQVRPALGRTFVPSDCARGAAASLVLSDALWRSAFSADPSIVGRSVSINRTAFTVIGVAPPSFTGTQLVAEDAFAALAGQTAVTRGRDLVGNANMSWLFVIGRLRDRASLAGARAALAVVAGRLTAAEHSGRTFRFPAGRATLAGQGDIRDLVVGGSAAIVGGVTLVLLIACANIANLLLARATARRKEFALRLALGASRARVVQQLLTESLLLAAAGGALGYTVAVWGARAAVRALLAHLPAGSWPVVFDPAPDTMVVSYAAAMTTLTALAFGLVPALRGTRDAMLEFRTAASTERPASRRLQHGLVAVQLAVCLVLLVSAGLLARGLYRAHTIDPGLAMSDVSVVAYDLPGAGYSAAAAAAFERRAVDRLSTMPGVRGVALTSAVPLSDQHQETQFGIGGSDQQRFLEFSEVSASYFALLGIPLVHGRGFLPEETASGRAAIVSESTARRLWPGANPLERSLTLDGVARPVVGVTRDAQVSRLGQPDGIYVFLPAGSSPPSAALSSSGVTSPNRYVLVGASPALSPRAIAETIRGMDRELAVQVTRLPENLEQWQEPSLLVSSLAAALALLALVLACTGVFGTVAYAVSRRTREIGIRVALGAAGRDVQRLIIRQGMRPVLAGMLAGLAGAAAASSLLTNMLFGISPHDPWAFVLAPAALGGIALLACYLPARRAVRVEPTVALRAE